MMIPHNCPSPILKKRHRNFNINGNGTSSIRYSSTLIDPDYGSGTLTESPPSQKLRKIASSPSLTSTFFSTPISGGFNDASTADVILRLYTDNSDQMKSSPVADINENDVQIYLHSSALCRAKYFATVLSDRWRVKSNGNNDSDRQMFQKLNLCVSSNSGSFHSHLTVLQLLYIDDFSAEISSVATAISILPVAMKLLFEDCVRQCVRFLEAVPWSEEEEGEILNLVPYLSEEESKELLARVSASKSDSYDQMLNNLLLSAKQNHPNMAPVKAFVAKLLREFSSRNSAKRVLETAFSTSLKAVKESLEEYSSPDFRGDHNETEAIQRLNLHTALTNGKHLLWIVERMIELRVADMAVKEWSEQESLAADLQRAFRDDAWRNIVPGLPTVVLKCTSKLADAVAAGSILVAREVRMKFVKDWLPVLIVCKDNASPSHKSMLHSPKSLYLELEETFLRIISTLPMDDSQDLLQQCLRFSTRDSEDCPHLITAFNTWFRRASLPPYAQVP